MFTTFTKTLAEDIRLHLQQLCTPQEQEKIQVINIDQWALNLLRRFGYKSKLLYEESECRAYWNAALSAMPDNIELPECSTLTTSSLARRRSSSSEAPEENATWGVIMLPGFSSSAPGTAGSLSSTSSATAANRPDSTATTAASVSTTPPTADVDQHSAELGLRQQVGVYKVVGFRR